MSTSSADQAYCAEQVESGDPDRYLSSLFALEEVRAGLHALYAFNLEIAKVREVTGEPMIGEIRLQWWREVIEEIYNGSPRRHAVVQPLEQAITKHNLPRQLFDELIDARSFDLYEAPMASASALKDYVNVTSGHVFRLAGRICNDAQGDDRFAAMAGDAWAMTGLIRAWPQQAQRRQKFFPAELIGNDVDYQKHSVEKLADALHPHFRKIGEQQRETLADLKSYSRRLKPEGLPAYLHLGLVELYLKQLERANWNPVKSRNVTNFARQSKALWISLRGRL